jgi:heme A synthase
MDAASYIVIACGIIQLLMIFFAKSLREKIKTVEIRTSLICMAIFFILAGVFQELDSIHSFSLSFRTLFRILSSILFGMSLGIILTLRIFGQFKFGKTN